MPKNTPPSRKKSANGGRPGGTPRNTTAQGRTPPQPAARSAAGGDSASTRSRLEELRARKPAPAANQRYRRRNERAWWQGPFPVIGTVVVVVALIALFIALGRGGSGQTTTGGAVPPQVLNDVTQVNTNVFKQVGNGGLTNPLRPITGATPLVGANGKPEMLYIGAEYCPYCAAERWSMVVALSRFGTFHNLQLTQSAGAPEVYPDTNTFSFYGSTYTSQYLNFSSVELTTRDSNTPLQTPTAQQQQLMNTYDAPPYVPANEAGGIPFIDVANQSYTVSAGYNPQLLAGLTWQQIASKLNNPSDPVTRAIVGNANYLTNAICKATNNQPAAVCTSAPITRIGAPSPAGA